MGFWVHGQGCGQRPHVRLVSAVKAYWSSQIPDILQFQFISYMFTPSISFLPHLLPVFLAQSHHASALYSQSYVIALQLSRPELKFSVYACNFICCFYFISFHFSNNWITFHIWHLWTSALLKFTGMFFVSRPLFSFLLFCTKRPNNWVWVFSLLHLCSGVIWLLSEFKWKLPSG